MASASAIKSGEAYVEMSLDDRKFNAGLSRAVAKLKQFASSLRQMGLVSVGAAVAMAPLVKTFVSFDDSMRALAAKTGASAAEFDSLRAKALELGRTTSFTADQIAELMVSLGTAGFDPAEIDKMTDSVLDLARATRTEAALSADILGATLNQFGLGADKARQVADRLAKADQVSATTLTAIGETLQYLGPTANDIGLSVEQTLALVSGLAKVGVKGSEAGTALRRIGLLATTGAADLERLFGVAGKDAAGNARQLVDILEDVQKATKDMPTAERAAKLMEAFGVLGVTSASALGKLTDAVRKFNKDISESDGVAAKTARDMDAGLGGAWRRLTGSAVTAAIALGESLAPALALAGAAFVAALDQLTAWINGNVELATAVGATVILLVALGLAAGVAGLAMKGFGLVVFAVKTAVAAFSVVVALATLVLGAFTSLAVAIPLLIGVMIAGIVLGAAKASGALATLGETFGRLGKIVGDTFGGVVAAFKKGDLALAWDILLTGLSAAYLTFVAGLRKAWFEFCNYFRDAFADVVLTIRTLFLDMLVGIINGINSVAGRIKNIAEPALPEAVKKEYERLDAPTQKKRDAEIAYQNREFAKLKTLGEPKFAGEGKPLDYGPRQAVAEALIENINLSNARVLKLDEESKRHYEQARAGDKFIDTRPFEQAIKDLKALDQQERDARNKSQADVLKKIEEERDAKLAALAELVRQANLEVAPMPREVGDPNEAPMPHTPLRDAGAALGGAVKGLYQSADFRGALALGPPNEYARQTATGVQNVATILQDRIFPVLQAIERKSGAVMFS